MGQDEKRRIGVGEREKYYINVEDDTTEHPPDDEISHTRRIEDQTNSKSMGEGIHGIEKVRRCNNPTRSERDAAGIAHSGAILIGRNYPNH
ncbi:MAG: hypothetical protein LUO93_10675 [Methanomicrobiales archaeon]|nr:hypothetical protein [Methanomicrobiales archaeon]